MNKDVAMVGGQNCQPPQELRGANIVYYIPSHGGDGEEVVISISTTE